MTRRSAWVAAYHAAGALAVVLGVPLAVAWAHLARRPWRHGFGQRFGAAPEMRPGSVWLHAASVGEVRAAEPLLHLLADERPDLALSLSVTTASGLETASGLAAAAGLATAGRLERCLAGAPFHPPLDVAPFVRRALRRIRPCALVVVETELWPNLFRAATRGGVPVALVNARLSERSFSRYRLVRPLVAEALGRVRLVAARSAEDAERFLALGAPPAAVAVTGNLKADAARHLAARPSEEPWERAAGLTQAPWLAFASTAAGEESWLLEAWAVLRVRQPRLRLLLAPRRPERFAEVEAQVLAAGFPCLRRSRVTADGPATPPGGVLLLDTVGELARLYGHAEAVFVGGSLVPHGGQNLLEPAAAGRPVLFGPHVANFRDAEAALLETGGGELVSTASLAGRLEELLSNDTQRTSMGHAARAAVAAHAGATRRTLSLLLPLLPSAPAGGRGPC